MANANPEGCNQYKDCAGGESGSGDDLASRVEKLIPLKAGQSAKFNGKAFDGTVEGTFDVKIIDPHVNKDEVDKIEGKGKRQRMYNKEGRSHLAVALVERPEQKRLSGEVRPAKQFKVYHHYLTANQGQYGNPQSKNTGKFKPHGAGTGKGEVHEAAQAGSMVLDADDWRLGTEARNAMQALWALDADKLTRARAAAGKLYADQDDGYWPAVAHVYKRMGGTVKTSKTKVDNELDLTFVDNLLVTLDGELVFNADDDADFVDDLLANADGCSWVTTGTGSKLCIGDKGGEVEKGPPGAKNWFESRSGDKKSRSAEKPPTAKHAPASAKPENAPKAESKASGSKVTRMKRSEAVSYLQSVKKMSPEERAKNHSKIQKIGKALGLTKGRKAGDVYDHPELGRIRIAGKGGATKQSLADKELGAATAPLSSGKSGADALKRAYDSAEFKKAVTGWASKPAAPAPKPSTPTAKAAPQRPSAAGAKERTERRRASAEAADRKAADTAYDEESKRLSELLGNSADQTAERFVRQLVCNQLTDGDRDGSPFINQKEPNMALKEGQRAELITWITVNCKCWQGDDDVETLNSFTDDKLIDIAKEGDAKRKAELALNAATRPFKLGKTKLVWNADEEEFQAMPVAPKKKAAPAAAAEGEAEMEEDEELYAADAPDTSADRSKRKGLAAPAMNAQPRKAANLAEWFLMAPDEAGSSPEATWNRYVAGDKRERATLIANLSRHLEGEPRKRLASRLDAMDTDDLKTMQLTRVGFQQPPVGNSSGERPADYTGAGGPPIYNVHAGDEQEDDFPEVSPMDEAVTWNQRQHKAKYRNEPTLEVTEVA